MSFIPSTKFQKAAFGELETITPQPLMQASAVYGIPPQITQLTSVTGSVSVSDNQFVCNTGASALSIAACFSNRAVIYKAGQGAEIRFTAVFTSGAGVNTEQLAGFLNGTDGFAIGYNGSQFGVVRRYGGQQSINELQITTPAGGSENATVTIDNVAYTVPLTAGTVQENAIEVADSLNSQVGLFDFTAVNDTVVCRSVLGTTNNGTFSFSSSTAAGTFTNIINSSPVNEDWTYQADFNGIDTSWLDTTKGNVYRIIYQYLGYGRITFFVERPETGEFEVMHSINYANTATVPHVSNPDFRCGWSVSNNADAESVVIKGASIGMFKQGESVILEPAKTLRGDGNTDTTEIPLFTLRCRDVLGTKINIPPIIPEFLDGYTEGTRGALIKVYKDAELTGAVFQYVDKATSIALVDTSATAFTGGTEVYSKQVSNSGTPQSDLRSLNLEILPNQQYTVTIQQLRGAAADCSATLIYQENK